MNHKIQSRHQFLALPNLTLATKLVFLTVDSQYDEPTKTVWNLPPTLQVLRIPKIYFQLLKVMPALRILHCEYVSEPTYDWDFDDTLPKALLPELRELGISEDEYLDLTGLVELAPRLHTVQGELVRLDRIMPSLRHLICYGLFDHFSLLPGLKRLTLLEWNHGDPRVISPELPLHVICNTPTN